MKGPIAWGAFALLVLVTAVVALGGRDDHFELRVPLDNASGLKTGSPVVVGGMTRGKVTLQIRDDAVVAELKLNPEVGPIGRNARVTVAATNFLGQKRIELDPGDDRSHPVPSGWTVPASRVTTPTDLDQVLAVMDADTRTRATILLNEVGAAVVGRRMDIRQVLDEFPMGIKDATRVLTQLETDDRTLRELVDRSDRFVAAAAGRRGDIGRMIDATGRTAQAVTGRRAQLRATLARAPQTLTTLRAFLADLKATTEPLGPAAREISASAPELSAVLAEVKPFARSARPTLEKATDVAPQLTRLADGATPVLRRARPTVRTLDQLARALPGLTDTLDKSSDNILAILENWSRAIQFRDGMGHVFRGEASLPPDLVLTMLHRLGITGLEKAVTPKTSVKQDAAPAKARPDTPAPDGSHRPDNAPKLPPAVTNLLPNATEALKDLLSPKKAGAGPAPAPADSTRSLLDFLLNP